MTEDSSGPAGTDPENKPWFLEYEQTTAYFHSLTQIRFKLLAIVPIVTGITAGLIARFGTGTTSSVPGSMIAAISLLGLLVTLGVIFYDQRNSQLYNGVLAHAHSLEEKLPKGGPYSNRPDRDKFLFGWWQIWGDRGLAVIYSAAVGTWLYLFMFGALKEATSVNSVLLPVLKIIIPTLASLAFLVELHRLDEDPDRLRRVRKYPDAPAVQNLTAVWYRVWGLVLQAIILGGMAIAAWLMT